MDLSCIISSGDLELYVLGMLPEEEAVKIEQLSKIFPEVEEEIERITESLQGFADNASIAPSPSVKEDLMSKLKGLKALENTDGVADVVPIYRAQSETDKAPVVSLPQRSARFPLWAAASLLGILLSLGVIGYLLSENKKNNDQLVSSRLQINTLQRQLSGQQQEMTAYSQTLQMMQNADYRKIDLLNIPGKASGHAQVMWNTKTHEVFLAGVSLPAPPSGKQYQLWAIVDGKPVDAGVMHEIKNVAQKMKTFDRAEAFAISIEKEGGNPTPTEVYMMGKV